MTNIFTFGKTASHLYLTFCILEYFFHNCIPPWVSHLFHLILQSVHGFPYLCTTSTPPYLCAPSTHTRMALKVEGNSLDLKIRMSLPLCSCRVASPKAAPCYGWALSFLLVCGPHAHTPTTHTRELIYFPKDTQKQLSLLFCSFVIVVIPFQANLALVLCCGCAAVRMRPRTQQQ